jgi:hypothetical protein
MQLDFLGTLAPSKPMATINICLPNATTTDSRKPTPKSRGSLLQKRTPSGRGFGSGSKIGRSRDIGPGRKIRCASPANRRPLRISGVDESSCEESNTPPSKTRRIAGGAGTECPILIHGERSVDDDGPGLSRDHGPSGPGARCPWRRSGLSNLDLDVGISVPVGGNKLLAHRKNTYRCVNASR